MQYVNATSANYQIHTETSTCIYLFLILPFFITDSCKRSSSSLVKPIVTSTPSVASLVGKPLVSMPPPQVCTKPCCCPPLVLPQYPFLQHRIPSSSIQVPYHPGFYTSQTAGVPPVSLWNAPPLFYSFRPSLALQVPRSSRHGAPMPFR